MTREELVQLLESNGYPTRVRGDEVQIETCWFCTNDKYNLELNAGKAIAHCWACRKGYRLDDLLRQMLGLDLRLDVNPDGGRDPLPAPDRSAQQDQLQLVPSYTVASAAAYLHARGVSVEEQRLYEIGVCTNQTHQFAGRIIFPLREFWTRKYIGVASRRYVGADGPKYMNDCERRIAGFLQPDFKRAPFVLCEGIFDGIAIHRAGGNAAVLLGTGHPAVEEWADRVPAEAEVLVCLDGAAVHEATRLYGRVKAVHRNTKLVRLPAEYDPGVLNAEVLSALFVHAS